MMSQVLGTADLPCDADDTSLEPAARSQSLLLDALVQACGSMPFAFALADDGCRVVLASKSFRRGFGIAVGDVLGRADLGLATSDSGTHSFSRQSLAGGYTLLIPEIAPEKLDVAAPQWRNLEYTDALTGLPNRLELRARLEQALAATDTDPGSALLLLDLDRFKAVNDTLGHPIGDKLLCRVVERLQKIVRGEDLIVRLGGDEFAILQVSSRQPEAALSLAQRLVDVVGRSYIVDDHLINIGASVGIALLPGDGKDPDRLLTSADLALYSAKESGRATFRLFDQEMDVRALARRTLELDLRKALALREFDLHYQPQLNLSGGAIGGFEALLRWRHPVEGLISPAKFIPIAEETGLIIQIGEWVLRTACKEAMNWPDHISIAVNLSPVQFTHADLVPKVISALAWSGLPARRLELEITESVLLSDTAATLKTLHQLKELGIRVAMDDFGTGYSSLSYLRAFPFDKVKIDQSFIREMHADDSCAAIIRAVVGLGISLGIATTAEGVETQQQLEQLRSEGCTDVQGYLISKPVPAANVEALLRLAG